LSSRTRTLLFVNGALLLVLIGFGVALTVMDRNDSPSTAPTSTSSSVVASTTAPEETAVTVGIICTTPQDATETLVGSWIAGAEAAAARCADQAVVDELFRTSGAGATWVFQGCDGPDPGVPQCQYSYEGGGATFTLNGTEAAGWKVTALEFIAD
jgi:hypothetical protein